MSVFAKIVQLGIGFLSLASLANFKVDTVAGIAGAVNIAYWGLGDLVWRTKEAKATLAKRSVWDRRTTLMTVFGISAMTTISNAALWFHRGRLPDLSREQLTIGFAGLAFGLWLRRSAMLELGSMFTRTLTTVAEHRVCNTGPYRWVRHPGYTANGIFFLSYAYLVARDPRVIALNASLFMIVWSTRIRCEEAMMEADAALAEPYKKYKASVTAKLLPFVY